ncbi:MAG: hypothetical protein HGB23_11325 [Chlorobiaceae bacterium]|nr:hypothetical protein [Chlorobiaceae bacterium]
MNTITKEEVREQTITMLETEWNTELFENKSLRLLPTDGLGKCDKDIRALEGPIESNYFSDFHPDVSGDQLIAAKDVNDLCDIIWDAIPKGNRSV